MTKHFVDSKYCCPNERGRVTRSSNVLGCEPASYLQITKSCFTKYSEYIELLLFYLHCRLVPWPKWLTLCNTCFNFISTTTKEERKDNFEKLLDQKFGPAPLKYDEKARLKAEYETLLVNVATIQEKLKLKLEFKENRSEGTLSQH